ncbi:hypothetical protein NE237_026579 [Protea cynaroides]|uniref:Uncharacterized protein n=1 Tax=Protea cynaroides TaxID=273540 RepID=A0A9Q0H6Y9_9MAGN|nr:hypothetical protein NE237_026579 [Protea cynaroides]
MKGGKEEGKIMGPLFPRLHVNDKEKGGPRAPPRNKMALYEQLSVPSQRFNSWSASTLSQPLRNADTLVPSTPSSQGGDHERSVFSPVYVPPPTPSHSTEKLHSSSPDGVNLNASMPVSERKSMKNACYQTSDATGRMLLTSECNSFHPFDYSNSKNSGQKKLGDEDDVRVPTFVHPEVASCPNKDLPSMERERLASFCPTSQGRSADTLVNSPLNPAGTSSNFLMQHQNGSDKYSKQTSTTDMRSRKQIRDHCEENLKGSIMSRERAGVKVSMPLMHTDRSANLERQSNLLDDHGRLCDADRLVQQKNRAGLFQNNSACVDGILVKPVGLEKRDITRVRSEPCSIKSPGNSRRSPDQAENGTDYHEDYACGSLQVGDVDRNDEVSETSMVDSMSGLDISPDDVVGVIGQKRFWKARKAIVNQQRLFAVQVFELHRLIKVQRLIAGSPHLLLENNCYLAKPSLNVSPTNKLPSDYVLKSPQRNVKKIGDSQKPNQSTECDAENTFGKPTLPSLNNGINRGLVSQHSNCGPYSRNPPPAPVGTDSNMGPWCFHPPSGNQWLVPILSPSEGLIYKPYTGPCPHAGFMAPVYGGCGPQSLPLVARDLMNPAHGVQATHQGIGFLPGVPPVGQTYFPPYSFPVMSPVMPASAVEQASLLANARLHGQAGQLSTGEINFIHQQRSCNYANQKSDAVDSGIWKFQTSKDGELRGSTASSPCEKAQVAGSGHVDERDPLLPFPMAPAVQGSDCNPQAPSSDQQVRVIKVAPHNPRFATESAARIFRSIQRERHQYDSV